MTVALFLTVAIAGVAQSPSPADAPTTIAAFPLRTALLTKAQAVRRLSPTDLKRPIPAVISGVVTHVNHAIPDLFVNDDSAGVYVQPLALDPDIRVGDLVTVRGTAHAGDFAPCIADATVERAMGVVRFPDPMPFDCNRDDSRWLDAQWVQVLATGESVRAENGRTVLMVRSSRGTGRVILHGTDEPLAFSDCVGQRLRIRAVCVPAFDARRRIVDGSSRLFVTSADQVTVLPNPVERGREPILLIDHLRQFVPSPHPAARVVRVEGVVTATIQSTICVQDGPAGVSADVEGPATVVPGDRVRVVGRLDIRRARSHLTKARVEVLGRAELPPPATPTEAEFGDWSPHGTRVRVVARLVEIEGATTDHPVAVVEIGGVRGLITAPVDPDFALRLPVPSTVAVTATAFYDRVNEWNASVGLIVADASDVELVSVPASPPFWQTPPGLALSAGLILVVGMGTGWVLLLRRTIHRQTVDLRDKAARERELAEKLRQSAKMEAIGRLAGGIAHDFNNLLTVINGSAELLPDFVPDNEAATDLAADIRSAGQKAAGLVAQLLTFSRQRPTQLAPLDLNDVVRDAEKLLGRLLGEDLTLTVEKGSGVPRVLGEPVLLHQVIVNLAVNARDAMPDGGRLTIATAATAAGARLTVADTGCGMSDEVKAKLFEPFFTTKDVGKGTGLGLATVYGIVQTLGGEVHVRSDLGRGTTFDIDLPAAPEDAADTPPNGTITHRGLRAVAAKTTVLLVEDDDAVRALVRRVLETDGYRVLASDSPHAALATLDTAHVDVLITDVVMPGMGGRDLAEAVRARLPNVKILFMSGYTADEILRRGVQEDEVDFLHKPFPNATLSAKVSELARRTGAKSSRFKMPPPRELPVA
jgi:two-component system cell cycle sensor histidine kinase/response regulator CckA